MVRTFRRLQDVPADIALGTDLVREYVVATAEEVGQDLDVILTLIPELHDFAGRYLRGGAFLVATNSATTNSDTTNDAATNDAATNDAEIEGAVGITPSADGICEMNRLWIRPGFRRAGAGRALCKESMRVARELGFRRMHLDVVPERTNAIAMYRSLGFVETPAEHEYPFAMVFLGRDL